MSIPRLRDQGKIFFRTGSFTFGGGSATVVALEKEIVEDHRWLERSSFRLAYGIARLTPGTTILATCTAVGWRLRGWRGATVALLAASVPCAIVAGVVTFFWQTLSVQPWALAAMRGATAAAVGIVAASLWSLLKPYLKSTAPLRLILFAGGATILSLYGVPPFRVLLLAVLIGLLWREEGAA